MSPYVSFNPQMKFGRPTIGGTGISVDVIAEMVWAGDDVDMLADEYSSDDRPVTRDDVLTACWFVGTHGSRAWRRRWKAWADEAHRHMHVGDWHLVTDPPTKGGSND